MPHGWAVGGAAALGTSAAFALLVTPTQPLLIALCLGMWAYALVRASHGSKGALVALAAYGIAAAALVLATREWAYAAAPALVGIAAAGAAADELRRRRGGVQWGTAAFLGAPILLLVGALAVVALRG